VNGAGPAGCDAGQAPPHVVQPWQVVPACVPASRGGEWVRLVTFAAVVWECAPVDARDSLATYVGVYVERYGVVPSLRAVRESLARVLDGQD